MKAFTPKLITYIASICLLIILVTQAYLIYDYFQTTRSGLIRESDAIIEEACKQDLKIRHNLFKVIEANESFRLSQSSATPVNKEEVRYDFRKRKDYTNNILGLIDLAVNMTISKKVPLDIQRLDSIVGTVLRSRGINTQYCVTLVDPVAAKVLQRSKSEQISSTFQVSSKYLTVDIIDNKALQLVLVNPFDIIIRRMSLLLISSILLTIICMFAFRQLFLIFDRQKKLMEVKSDFFGNTAHELKRPVAQLHLALEALSKPAILNNTAKRERYLAISTEATRDMSEKITMIMTLSMAEEGVFKLNYSRFNLLNELQSLKHQFLGVTNKDVNILIVNTTDDCSILADRDHLRQCLANLLDNAIKYSGSSVLISITLKKLKDSLCISVKDNGIGINADKLERIFEKYTRLNNETGAPTGFGIGLSYVKTVVEKHKGCIEVQSEPQNGSEFRVYLPA